MEFIKCPYLQQMPSLPLMSYGGAGGGGCVCVSVCQPLKVSVWVSLSMCVFVHACVMPVCVSVSKVDHDTHSIILIHVKLFLPRSF